MREQRRGGNIDTEVKGHAELNAGDVHYSGITADFQETGTGGFRLLGRE
ncbi:hypothetical protein [Neptunomonas sp.]